MAKRISIIIGFFVLLFPIWAFAAAPALHFSDLISGPDTGLGDGHGSGTIVTIWGHHLGSSQGDSQIYFKDSGNTVRAAAYVYYWGNVDGTDAPTANLYDKLGLQEVCFSIPDSAPGTGKIYVTVGGQTSNELDFTVRSGGIYYVDFNASSGSGTYADPWSPSQWYDNMKAGDTGYFRAGTYSKGYGYNSAAIFNIYPSSEGGDCAEGTEANPIAFVAYPNELVYFNNLTSAGIKVYGAVFEADYFVISKLRFYTYSYASEFSNGWRVIGNDARGMTATSEIQTGCIAGRAKKGARIFGNEVHGGRTGAKKDHAIYPGGCPSEGYIDIGWNYIYDNNFDRGPLVSNNHEGSRCGSGEYVQDPRVHDNIIDCTNYPSRAISGNLSYSHGDPVIPTYYIYNNIIIGCGAPSEGAVRVRNGKNKVFNNVLYNIPYEGIEVRCITDNSCAHDTWIYNNIIHLQSGAEEYIDAGTQFTNNTLGTLYVDKNVYYGNGDYRNEDDDDAINTDPKMTDPANGDFSLQSDSPCKDTGTSEVSSVVPRDIAGNSRPQGNGYDIGAYEYFAGGYKGEEPLAPTNLRIIASSN